MENITLTAGEIISYLLGFQEDSEVSIVAIDTHQEKKVRFTDRDVILITDEANPTIFVDIDRNRTEDITDDDEEEP